MIDEERERPASDRDSDAGQATVVVHYPEGLRRCEFHGPVVGGDFQGVLETVVAAGGVGAAGMVAKEIVKQVGETAREKLRQHGATGRARLRSKTEPSDQSESDQSAADD